MTKPTIYTVAHPEDLSPPLKNQGFCVDVVLASDYAALEQELAEARCRSAPGRWSSPAALKAFGDKLSEMHNALNGEGTGIQGRAEVACQQVALESAMEEFDAIETPATDAAIAELRAQGVDLFAVDLGRVYQQLRPTSTQAKALKSVIYRAQVFISSLRAEASK
ncbi:hypothetical protein ABW09_12045 [Pluralibacter gergoviae]|uniref:hypothetical protein n=1 Tax=Pluralibacter gergoviae TaxID=61647 RepID=UPI000652244B|nr:hypothetical protein [Pluralibacter gergoviae]KMK17772.1 hypothetical protein ABW09_12045 [Pluralibacter gergoviae]